MMPFLCLRFQTSDASFALDDSYIQHMVVLLSSPAKVENQTEMRYTHTECTERTVVINVMLKLYMRFIQHVTPC